MPKSNSDADENESLTSDEETTSPTRATFAPGPAPRPRSPIQVTSPTNSHRFSRIQSRRPTINQRQPSTIDPNAKPIDKFRSAVEMVMRVNKTHIALKDLTPGIEPDLRYSNPYELYGHLHQDCKVHVWDYGPTKARPLQFNTNHSFIEWFGSKQSERGLWNGNVEEDAAAKASRKKEANIKAIDALKAGTGQIKIDVASVFMFLLRDGTFITLQRDPEREFAQPIYDRLRLRDTLLRSSGDASLLLQSLIDMIVDDAVKITDKYHRRLLKMERDILLKTKMKTVRDLHIASEDLMLHKRTMGPISQLVYGLRRYDADRAKASRYRPKAVAIEADGPVGGFLSHQSKVYLADVHDHIEYILSSLDMFSSIAENLISYTFNIVSYETNQVMRGLTIATVIFFPLTFLTGYFGMNFATMPSVMEHSEAM
ncbi:hypothetical protein FRC09_015181 [Ceratobasidium sp. 395]|nr:hypothetical protein FRC09_015181 [Ceratobasidium sp. 395]